MLDRETMLAAMRGPIAEIAVPEWGGEVGIRRLSAADLVAFRATIKEADGSDGANLDAAATLLAMALCGDDGKPFLTADEIKQWDAQQMPLLNRLAEQVNVHNGIDKASVEDLEKNSASGEKSESI